MIPTNLMNQSQISSVLTLDEVFKMVDLTYRGLAEGTVKNPPKLTLDLGEAEAFPPYHGFTNAMPAYIGFQDVVGLKWVGGNSGHRRELKRTFIHGLIILQDPQTGDYLAVMDGERITSLRTGAQTATSLSYIKHKPKIRLGMFGAGREARANIYAIANRFEIEELKIWNHRLKTAEKLVEEIKSAKIVTGDVIAVHPDHPEVAADSDVIVTVTLSKEPIVQADMVQPGTVIFPMGSYQEVSDELLLKADKVIVDHPTSALHRGALKALNQAGKFTESDLFASIPEMATQPDLVDEIHSDDIIVIIPIGIGALDIAVAYRAYELLQQSQTPLQTFNFLD